MANKIFISHAAENKELVAEFEDFLSGGMDIKRSEIFFSSRSGSIPIGEAFIERIRKEIEGCEVVIFLISEEYMKSFFCHIEWGAAWALGKIIKPIVIPPYTFKDLKEPVNGLQGIMLNDKAGLGLLYDELHNLGIATSTSFNFYNKVDKFMETVEKLTARSVSQTAESDHGVKILRADSEGYYTARVTEVYVREPGCYYRIDGRISKEELEKLSGNQHLENWSTEDTWLDNHFGAVTGIKENDIVRFNLKNSGFYAAISHGSEKLTNVRNLYFFSLKKV